MFKSTIIKGALILTLANIITRILGFVYRIYMSNTIGSEGMGLYQLITPLYLLAWALSSAGLSTSVSKLTAQELAREKTGNAKRLLYLAVFFSVSIAFIISIITHTFTKEIAEHFIKDIRTVFSLKILSYCFPFMAAGSVIRGYFLGTKNTYIPAAAQIIEQCVRMAAVYILSASMIAKGLEYACGAAVIGMAAGEIIAFSYTFIMYILKIKKVKITKATLSISTSLNMLMSMAVPLTLNRVSTSLFSTVESLLIPQRLQLWGLSAKDAISTLGILNGMAMPLIMFPSSLLTALATATMPVISESHELNMYHRIQRTIRQTMSVTAVISAATTGLFFTYPKELGYVIYSQPQMGDTLKILALVCPFLYIQVTISGILNGLGEQVFIFKVNIISSIINILAIYFLVPYFGINIFILSWIISSAIATLMTITRLKNTIQLKLHIFSSFIIPSLAIILSCLISLRLKYIMQFNNGRLSIIVLCMVTEIIYLSILTICGYKNKV